MEAAAALTLNEATVLREPTSPYIESGPSLISGFTPTFFYIGHNRDNIRIFSRYFEAGFMAASFRGAADILLNFEPGNIVIPDVILIDLPYDKAGLEELVGVIRKDRHFCTCPLLYNQQHMDKSDLADPHTRMLVDDVIDLGKPGSDLFVKVSFLKKFKAYESLTNMQHVATGGAAAAKPSRLGFHPEGKRLVDIFLASFLILVLSPVFLLIALAIRLESRGPILYTSLRAGRGYRIFRFFKFRTMRVGADDMMNEELVSRNKYKACDMEDCPMFFKMDNDPRATRIGNFLRDCSLDELPQLFNVLKGDMSLVGNRPLPLNEAATLTTNEFVDRFAAPAGITGLWQIEKRGKPEMSIVERARLDTSYARKRNFFFDLWILWHTPPAIFQKSVHETV